jgi:hypothetical protein
MGEKSFVRRWYHTVLRLIAIFALFSSPAWAGFCSPDSELRHSVDFFAGYSPASTTLIGTTTDRRFVLAGLGYEYRCWAWPGISISYSGQIMPAAVMLEPDHPVYGLAVTPIGFTADFGRRGRIYPFLEINGGIITSTEPIPINVTDATALNFLFDMGGGFKIRMGQRGALRLGYKFLHISNGFTTPVNPGVDNNVFYAGFSISPGRR